MSVYFCTPSARPIADAQECFNSWRTIGAKVAAGRDNLPDCYNMKLDLCTFIPSYQGYYREANLLVHRILTIDRTCNIVIVGGDDLWPDPNFSADRLEAEFIEHFGGTLGIMQPTGLAWDTEVIDGRATQERIAWGPWLGREWCERAYMGRGPYWDEPTHFFADELLQITAERLGLFWQRPDVMQEHRQATGPATPEHRVRANRHWDNDKQMFMRARHPDWPGAKLLPR